MRAESFSATPGEGFNFIGEDDQEWKGACLELRPVTDGLFQFRGVVHSGREDLIGIQICGQYDPKTESIELIA